MIRGAVFFCVLAAGLLASASASAACNALALCTCTVASTGVSFGSYSTLATNPNDAVGSVTVTCILTVAQSGTYTVELSSGSSGTFSTRTMRNGAATLNYNLFTTASRTVAWGDGTGGSQKVVGNVFPLLTSVQTLSVYGRAPAAQNVPAGPYADAVVVTVTY